MQLNFVTTNRMKFEAARLTCEAWPGDYELVQCPLDTPEIQAASVEDIARQSARWVAQQTNQPSIKMDVGFGITALNGFPGPFVKYVNDWLTQDDVLRLMAGTTDRTAYFIDALAIAYPDGTSHVCTVTTTGTLATTGTPHATRWPMNLLFIPDGYTQTLGSLSDDEQNRFWSQHNSSWPQLLAYLDHRRQPVAG